jgi:hypothetical protein
LSWPYRTHGSFDAPLSADRNGHFVISNVFAGGIVTAAIVAAMIRISNGVISK